MSQYHLQIIDFHLFYDACIQRIGVFKKNCWKIIAEYDLILKCFSAKIKQKWLHIRNKLFIFIIFNFQEIVHQIFNFQAIVHQKYSD